MTKLSKQEKIEIYHLWHDFQIGSTELSQRYRVGRFNIDYLLALINRHGLAILDQLFTTYTSSFEKQAPKRIIVDHEPPLSRSTRFRFKKLWHVIQLATGISKKWV